MSLLDKEPVKRAEKFLKNFDQSLEVIILEGQESFKLKPFQVANSWAIIPEGLEVINKDQKIEIVPLNIGESINI